MYDEERGRKNFIEGLVTLDKRLNFKTEKALKDYLWKRKDFSSLEVIADEENINKSFLKEFVFLNS